ncbi:hypothetical protein Gpo141_00000671 [Globisporangium polare]
MLPQRVARSPARRSAWTRKKLARCALYLLSVTSALYALRFLYSKCDTRAHMSALLTKTTTILKDNDVEYWLDKGTLLGVHRDDGLIPWEYDVDLGVMNSTCDEISALKSEFAKVGLVAYDRSDYIPHKVKLTYDTENHHFYWSDPYMHDPCIRVYDSSDISTWVDVYWYVEVEAKQVAASRENVLVPPSYDWNSSLLCCSEGLQEYTDHMCCGGCVPYDSVFPLKKQHVNVPDGVRPVQEQFVPNAIPQFLKIQYGSNALQSREIKGWKGVVCGFWTSPLLFAVHLATLVVAILLLVLWYRRSRSSRRFKPRSL